MSRNSGVSNVRATAFRSISGSVVPPAGPRASFESGRKFSQRMIDSIEPAFDLGKHVFGFVGRSWCGDYVLSSVGVRSVIASYLLQKESGTKSERLDKPCPVGDS